MHSDKPLRWAGCSGLWPQGAMRFLAGSVLVLGVLGVLALWLGPVHWSPLQGGSLSALQRFVLFELRMPRWVLGCLTGASLALAGFLLQSLTRVSIAAPSVLGLSDGAGLGVVGALYLGADWMGGRLLSPAGMALSALTGSLLVLLILRGLYRLRPDMTRLVFAGLVVAAVCKALISMLMLISQTDTASQAQLWLIGSLSQANPLLNRWLISLFILLLISTLLQYRSIAVLHLADEVGLSLGQKRGVAQARLYLLAAGFTALAVAGAGQVGFVGLVVPHVVRRLCPRGVPLQILGNMLVGAGLVVAADLLAKQLLRPVELPVGLVTAFIGVPCFLYLYLKGVRR